MTLRIQKSEEHKRVVLTLVGRIQANHVGELEALLSSEAGRSLVLDLKDIKLVDRDAVQFLARSEAEGTELLNCSAFIREWISQERNEMQRVKAEHRQL
jgi:anti-anti-sigma regulatory factor